MKTIAILGLLGACTVPSIGTSGAQPANARPASAPPTRAPLEEAGARQAAATDDDAPGSDESSDWAYVHLKSVLGMKVDDATATISGWHRSWKIEVNLVGANYDSDQEFIKDCDEGMVCGVNYRDVHEPGDTVVLDVRGKPDLGAPPPPP